MEVCKDFSQLPPELRLLIWEHALQNEAKGRLVLLQRTSRRVLPFRYLASPLLSVNVEARTVALKFYDIRLPVGPALPADSYGVQTERAWFVDNWWEHEITWYWDDFGGEIEVMIDESFQQNPKPGRDDRAHKGGAVYLSSRGDRLVESCDLWIDMGTICPGGHPTYDNYRCLDICKAHIMQDVSPDFTGISSAQPRPEIHSPRTYLSDPIAPDVLDRLRIGVTLTSPSLGAIHNVRWISPLLYNSCRQGLVGFLQAALPHVEGLSGFFRELALQGRGDYTILTGEAD